MRPACWRCRCSPGMPPSGRTPGPTSASVSASTSGSPAHKRFETSSVRLATADVAIAALVGEFEGGADKLTATRDVVSPTA